MRKVDIRARIHELDRRLQSHRDAPIDQRDERARLIHACRDASDHVFVRMWLGDLGVGTLCEFCGVQERATSEQISRGLVIG
jgi:hypothetical protein